MNFNEIPIGKKFTFPSKNYIWLKIREFKKSNFSKSPINIIAVRPFNRPIEAGDIFPDYDFLDWNEPLQLYE